MYDLYLNSYEERVIDEREYIKWTHFKQAAKIINIMRVEALGKTPLLY